MDTSPVTDSMVALTLKMESSIVRKATRQNCDKSGDGYQNNSAALKVPRKM